MFNKYVKKEKTHMKILIIIFSLIISIFILFVFVFVTNNDLFRKLIYQKLKVKKKT